MVVSSLSLDGIEIPSDVFTLEGFRTWFRNLEEGALGATFCDGDVHLEMTPQSYRSHAPLVTQVNAVLTLLTTELRLGMYFAPPSWLTCVEARLSTEPDGFLATFDALRAKRIQIHPDHEHEMVGRPDMVFEAVSNSSRRKDRDLLLERYARTGIPEYWVADGRTELEFQILVLDGSGTYQPQQPTDGWVESPTFGRWFRLTRLVNEVGLEDYRLELR